MIESGKPYECLPQLKGPIQGPNITLSDAIGWKRQSHRTLLHLPYLHSRLHLLLGERREESYSGTAFPVCVSLNERPYSTCRVVFP
jgi:hypothetical protein